MSSENKLPLLPGVPKKTKEPEDKGKEITIHVCDETKNLKKDFTCSRELLLQEMKYFQDYLSCDTERWEDVDISVHCDIKIFEWLINYIKNDSNNEGPSLDTKNVVSILISSDFLKMSKLVNKCIVFVRENLESIVASPCNMNCINDKLVTRIASTMDQHTLEMVIDKKDKFKSKLFSKKLEELFQPSHTNEYTLNNASCVYKCLFCKRLLLPNISEYIECTIKRTTLDNRGNLQYKHARDHEWNVMEYLISLKNEYKTWRLVYWRIWSSINFLKCKLCKVVFPFCDLNQCLTHPVDCELTYENDVTVYSCCKQPKRLFESIKTKSGCQYSKHEIDMSFSVDSQLSEKIIDELKLVKHLICVSKLSEINQQPCYNLVAMMNNKLPCQVAKEEPLRERSRPANQKLLETHRKPRRYHHSEDEDSETDEPGIVRVYIQHKENSLLTQNSSKTWNSDLPLRLNQDMQRESDLKRMNELLASLQLTDKKCETSNQKQDLSCGTFHCLNQRRKKDMNSLQSNSSINLPVNRKSRI